MPATSSARRFRRSNFRRRAKRGGWSSRVTSGGELPLLRDPELVNGCDILISESTYGNRVHPPAANIQADLLRIIRHACEVKGKVIIPAFSLGRTQQLVYFLNELTNTNQLPHVPVFVRSEERRVGKECRYEWTLYH